MPKKLDYPQSSFDRALKLADAVDSLGGSCSQETAGDKLGLSGTSGGFKQLVGATAKFNLIKIEKGILTNTPLYTSSTLAYTPEEKLEHLRESFLSPSIFRQIYEKFINRALPIEILDKMLIRDFQVDKAVASRVSKHFINGAKLVKLIGDNNVLLDKKSKSSTVEVIEPEEDTPSLSVDIQKAENYTVESQVIDSEKYLIHIIGPGLNTRLEISELDDFAIVEATINKLKKKLLNGSN